MYVHKMSNFINKPETGWLHPESVIANEGATYTVRYIGCLEVTTSTKALDYKTRSTVAKVCICKVSEAAGLKSVDKKRKIEKNVLRAIADRPRMQFAGTNVTLNISSSKLTLTSLDTKYVIASHEMPCISFASGGDADTLDFVAYIAKDAADWRACYVLECGGGLAKDVIATIGQAFELKFIQSRNSLPLALAIDFRLSMGHSSGSDPDKDYYNDLPGKVPPDFATVIMGPPPVPPLPAQVVPFTTLPQVLSPNLIDLNAEISMLDSCHHEYVNDSVLKERDVFDMPPFTHPPVQRRMDPVQLGELRAETWFHGQISRAQAEKLLLEDGDFLVRESPSSHGQYVLSGMQDNTKKHLLLIDPDGVVRTKDRMFNSVTHLIKYHCENALPIISAESALVLRVPVRRKYNIPNYT